MIVLEDFIAATGAEIITAGTHTIFEGFAHDSRATLPGECFVAVRGMHGNGHDFAADAIERGAGALVVTRAWMDEHSSSAESLISRSRRAGVTILAVDDTREALCRYAQAILAAWK